MRCKVKIMIGGGTVTEDVRKYSGADAYGKDAVAAVALSKKWVENIWLMYPLTEDENEEL